MIIDDGVVVSLVVGIVVGIIGTLFTQYILKLRKIAKAHEVKK